MKIARYRDGKNVGYGVVEGDRLRDVSASPELACGIAGFLVGGAKARAAVAAAAAKGREIPLS
ncbi:MAG: DUF2437 domain-containing protein [Alphaproteobacteria bacterium]